RCARRARRRAPRTRRPERATGAARARAAGRAGSPPPPPRAARRAGARGWGPRRRACRRRGASGARRERRGRALAGRRPGAAGLAQRLPALLHVEVALEPADAVDEEVAVEVVELVLEAHRAQAARLLDDLLAVEVGGAQHH